MKIQELITEGPGFGHQRHRGFGQGFFNRPLYSFFADQIARKARNDAVIGEWLTDWMSDVFRLDNPSFNAAAFRDMVRDGGPSRAQPRIQERHFYFLAHEIAAVDDPDAREFLTEWFADLFAGLNEYFQPERWRKFCDMDPASWQRRSVDSQRAAIKAADKRPATGSGDPDPIM